MFKSQFFNVMCVMCWTLEKAVNLLNFYKRNLESVH